MEQKYGYYKDGDIEADKRWFAHCQETDKPYVVVRFRTKLADVAWDYITFPSAWDEVLSEHKDEVVTRVIDVFKKHASKRSKYTVSCFVADFKELEIASAKKAATELHDLIKEYAPA